MATHWRITGAPDGRMPRLVAATLFPGPRHLGKRVPLERVRGAEACEVEALEHGGWGYPGNVRWPGRAAVVVRSGSAVRLQLRDGKHLSISVDDASTAAELINGFVQRRGATPDAGGAAQASALGQGR